jgi:hypothetical protein
VRLVAVIQISLSPAWFELDVPKRDGLRRDLWATLASHTNIEFRWYDADPWTGGGREFLLCEFSALPDYWNFWTALREQSLFRSFARFERVSLGYERPLMVGLVET